LLVYHDSELIYENGDAVNKNISDIINLHHGENPVPFLLFNCVSGHSLLFKRELLEYVLPFRQGYYHDHWMAYVAANVGTIGFVDKALVKYRQHQESNTDILNVRNKVEPGYHGNRDVNKLKRELKWLAFCAEYPNNKYPEFTKTFKTLFEKRMNSFISLRYALFLYKNRDQIFLLQKESLASKNSFIKRQMWGLRGKLLWGKLFSKPAK
jgi:hypothetical protein